MVPKKHQSSSSSIWLVYISTFPYHVVLSGSCVLIKGGSGSLTGGHCELVQLKGLPLPYHLQFLYLTSAGQHTGVATNIPEMTPTFCGRSLVHFPPQELMCLHWGAVGADSEGQQ